jgi:3-dehydroquinate synthase
VSEARENIPRPRAKQAGPDSVRRTIRVACGTGYPIWITRGGVTVAGGLLASLDPPLQGSTWALVSDPVVAALHGVPLRRGLADWTARAAVLLPAGEEAKTWHVAGDALRRLTASGLDRDGVLVCLGGGSVGDVGGFLAGLYLRGIAFVNVPSTLLAMVDASIGGKTGVNLPEGKNLAGLFHHPRAVLIDLELLATLPAPEWRNGWAEIVKVAITSDAALFKLLETHGPSTEEGVLDRCVERACSVKAAVVSADERDAGPRQILNFGHTVGHAIEAAGGYARHSHGEAVALGMACALELGVRLRVTPEPVALRCRELIERLGLPLAGSGFAPDELAPFLLRDKKAGRGRLAVVLTVEIGNSIIRRLLPDDPDLEGAIRSVA